MPRYYCDYCDTYLTHDSPSVRKQHNAGYKHKANVRTYYQQFEEQQTQSLIDQKIKEHLGQAAVQYQVGAAFNQFLPVNPQQPRLPVLPRPMMPMGMPPQVPIGAQFVPGVRPPVLQPPISGAPGRLGCKAVESLLKTKTFVLIKEDMLKASELQVVQLGETATFARIILPAGYGAAPTGPPSMAPPGATSIPMQLNSLPRPPMMNHPPGGVATIPTSNGATAVINPVSYQASSSFTSGPSSASAGAASSQENYGYAQASENNH